MSLEGWLAVDNKYIAFERGPDSPSGKTHSWHIYSTRSRDLLGTVRWYSKWRQYAFYPEPGSIWNPECLHTVQRFVTYEMNVREADRKARYV